MFTGTGIFVDGGMSDSFTVVIDIAMVDVYHVDVFQCNSVHSSDPIVIDPS